MAELTITYGIDSKGWTSFHSYIPEWMIGMNSNFYTFYQGNMWKHYSNNVRNNYYGSQYNSKVTPIINDNPDATKMFKTITLDTNSPWDTTITTDLSTGFMDAAYYSLKEGDYYSYIRRVAGNIDIDLMSAQGIGNPSNVDNSGAPTLVFTFTFDVGSIVSVGDTLYAGTGCVVGPAPDFILDCSGYQSVGVITGITSNTITVGTAAITPTTADYLLYLKDAEAESYGARGYYMEVELENDSTSEVELFTISSEVFKSFP